MPIRALITGALLCGVLCVAAAPAPAQAPADAGDFTIEYGTVKKVNRQAIGVLRRSGALEAVVAEVNSRWALPADVTILVGDDAEVGPAFIPDLDLGDGQTLTFINIPGDFLTLALRAMRQELRETRGVTANDGMVWANEFIVAHEMGHALVHQLDLPVTGREEDAVDGFAAYLLADNPKFGPLTALSAAIFFDAYRRLRGKLKDADFADEHSILEQRIYQFMCWVYGSDPATFRSLVGRGGLPRSRAARCGDEWRQLERSWDTLLAPHAIPPAPVAPPTPPPPAVPTR
jgi:hypothetical protein